MKDISLILARVILKVANQDEVDTISKWKNISDKNASFSNSMESYWNLLTEEKLFPRLDCVRKRLLIRINSTEKEQTRKSPMYFLSRIAAAVIFILSIAGLSIYIASETNLFYENNWVEVSTLAGQQSKVTLPDGSLVWINASTVLKFHQDKEERKVSLEGEAYFEVTHSAHIPFIVELGIAKVKVLGTKFNVSHYPGSNITEASLLSGKITISLNENGETVDLHPGEKVVYDAEKRLLSKNEVEVQKDILWRQGVLCFENEPFNNLISKLERFYGVKFIYDKNDFKDIHYTGTIDNLNINKVLQFINLTIPITYEIENKTIKLNLKKMR
ncbi:MAG: DUF4974 domain-containing protein [Prolixibacteraceae bacterium]|nr:DUF4974 domain-containing protein [Prolixibacteraceae bacterium]